MKKRILSALLVASSLSLAQQTYLMTTVAGVPQIPTGSATASSLGGANGIAIDSSGNAYVAVGQQSQVWKISPSGSILQVIGTGYPGFSGDGGPASAAQLNAPFGVALDPTGNLYIADLGNNRIRKVTPSGTISTFAGTGAGQFSGDGGLAINATFTPYCVGADNLGNVYVCDLGRVRRINTAGVIYTIAGGGSTQIGPPIPATTAALDLVNAITFDPAGNFYLIEPIDGLVLKVSSAGILTALFGGTGVRGVAVNSLGDLYVSAWYANGSNMLKYSAATGAVTPIFGSLSGFGGDGGPADQAQINQPTSVALDPTGALYFLDWGNARLRVVSPSFIISTRAGNGFQNYGGDGGPAVNAQVYLASGVALDSSGNLFIGDSGNNLVRKISTFGIMSTVAGNSSPLLSSPHRTLVDTFGNVIVSDSDNNVIRRISPSGVITTIAGNGTAGFSGDGGPATNAQLFSPSGLALDSAGNLYVADIFNQRIRKISLAGIITTVAGNGSAGFAMDGVPAVNAVLNNPAAVRFDSSGNLYIADTSNGRIRKVSSTGIISTVAGGGSSLADGVPATSALLSYPQSLAFDAAGNLLIADSSHYRIRSVSPGGTITTIAGNGLIGDLGDGGPALNAQMTYPSDLTVDSTGAIYVADSNRIRKLVPAITITSQPLNTSVSAGSTAIFTAAAMGSPTPDVQWQVSVAGGPYADLPVFSTTLTIPSVTPSMSGNQYRAVFYNSSGFAATNAATLTVLAAPTVVSVKVLWGSKSASLTGSTRNCLPWPVAGVQVVFSAPITAGNANSLAGVTASSFTGLGTNTLTWTFNPLSVGQFNLLFAGSGANALKDSSGTPIGNGAGASQLLRVLYGDYNDDGVVNALDQTSVLNVIRSAAYDLFGDMNGDGVVNLTDVQAVRSQIGNTLP